MVLCGTLDVYAQEDMFDKYVDFNQAIVSNNNTYALSLSKTILAGINELKPATQLAFYAKLAKVYQDTGDNSNAVIYYQKVIVQKPDYYVPHWALANIYLEESNSMVQKLNASKNNKAQYDKYQTEYKAHMYKILVHLERAQACDPTPETLNMIRNIYRQFKDTAKIQSLDSRLKALGQNCITLLPDA